MAMSDCEVFYRWVQRFNIIFSSEQTNIESQRHQGRDHRDAGRWAILGNGAFGNVQMDGRCLEKRVGRVNRAQEAACKVVRDRRALLHHVAHLARGGQTTAVTTALLVYIFDGCLDVQRRPPFF